MTASASSMPMNTAASTEPHRLPMPPTTTMMKARRMLLTPMVGSTPRIGAYRYPLMAAMAAPMPNTTVCTSGTGMPMAKAIWRSCVVARIHSPKRPRCMNSHKPPMMARESTATRKR